MEHYVIIGNGASANRAVDCLRDADHESRITIISDEPYLFYMRHRLRDFVVGDIEEKDLFLRDPSYYKARNCRLRLGQKVIKIDFQSKTLYLAHKEKVHYTKLLLCLGSKPRVPEIYYAFRHCFTFMKTLDDARDIKSRFNELKHIVIVGGDMVSMKVASSFLKKGKEVTFLLDRDAFWPLELTDQIRQEVVERLEHKHATVLHNEVIADCKITDDKRYEIVTNSGKRLSCDMVGGFFGLVPAVDFLMGSGLDIERGILVNENLETNIPDVFAAGDCAQVYNPEIRNYWVSIGWHNAEKLGEIAGFNLLGLSSKADQPKSSIFSFSGIKVDTAWWRNL